MVGVFLMSERVNELFLQERMRFEMYMESIYESGGSDTS